MGIPMYAIFAIIMAFFLTLIVGAPAIPILRRLKFGQNIREEGPKSHLKKAGTPQMGGVIFLIPLVAISLFLSRNSLDFTAVAVLVTMGYGLIGFIDDYIKVVKKRSLGLRAYQKMIGQIGIGVIFAYYAYTHPNIGSAITIPFFGGEWDLGIWYIPIITFIIVGVVNSVNLTDGLDGLASGVTLIVAVTFTIILSYMVSYAREQSMPYLFENYRNLAVFAGALTGVCLGFLRFNAHPAQVFMGDTGALGLGGAVVAIAVMTKLSLLLPIVGGIYVAETLSVIIQVVSFKLTGKRVFKMSPLHHHFELSGMHETKVVAMFMIVTAILCLFGLLAL